MTKNKKTLGELEAEIMEIIWNLKEASVRQVLTKLRKQREIAYTTVMTVMFRLFDKKILKRKLNESGAYIYYPRQDKINFFIAASKKAITDLIKDFGEVAVAQFFDLVESRDLKKSKEWRKKLTNIK